MQDIIEKIDQRVTSLVVFEQCELTPSDGILAALLALHEDMALALRRIDTWQHMLELWLRATGLNALGPAEFSAKLIQSNDKQA
jgi:hypothetical protein